MTEEEMIQKAYEVYPDIKKDEAGRKLRNNLNALQSLKRQAYIRAIKDMQSIYSHWIPVHESLPELVSGWSKYVLVLEDSRFPRLAQYQDNKYGKGWVGNTISKYSNITHWIPIPEL